MSVKRNENGSYIIKEDDLDPLKLIFLEEKLGLKLGILSKYKILDWRYIEDNKQLILVFNDEFDWLYYADEFDPPGLDRNGIKQYMGLTFVPFKNISIE